MRRVVEYTIRRVIECIVRQFRIEKEIECIVRPFQREIVRVHRNLWRLYPYDESNNAQCERKKVQHSHDKVVGQSHDTIIVLWFIVRLIGKVLRWKKSYNSHRHWRVRRSISTQCRQVNRFSSFNCYQKCLFKSC